MEHAPPCESLQFVLLTKLSCNPQDDGNIETIVVHKHCIHRFWRFMVTFAVVGFLLVLGAFISTRTGGASASAAIPIAAC